MKIVNKLHRFFHTPLNNWQIVFLVGIVVFYLCISIVACFTISAELAWYMYIIFFAHVLLLLAIVRLCDYLYKKQEQQVK